MGCQRDIARQIHQQGADYVLTLKKNQPRLLERVETLFAPVRQGLRPDRAVDYYEQREKSHGRLETRRCWAMAMPDWRFYLDPKEQWEGLRTIVMVERTRRIKDEETTEYHYYIATLAHDAREILNAVRTHWGIENRVHWILDIAFREDESRVRADNGQFVLSLLRRLALNLLRHDTSRHGGIKNKRLRAAWDNDYLLHILSQTLNA